MKKLMIALTAVATAFGLYADAVTHQDPGFISGTSFEPSEDGTSGDITQGYWVPPTGGGLTIVDKTSGKPTTSNRPLQYLAVADAKELAVKTTLGDAATLKCTLDGAGKFPIPTDGLYFDGLVNFTVFDATDTIPAADLDGAKIGVYLQLAEEDESKGTNFVVVAKSTTGATAEEFVCTIAGVDLAGWHRLTIKAISDIGDTDHNVGFVVFIDGEKAKCTGAKLTTTLSPQAAEFNEVGALFVSMVKDANITSVSFDGQGSVDDLVFTTKAPEFAADSDFQLVTWTASKVDSITIGGVTYTGDTNTGRAYAKITYAGTPAVAQPIAYSWTGKGTFIDGNGEIKTPSKTSTADIDGEILPAVAMFGDKKYAALDGDEGAVKAANDASSGTLKLINTKATDNIALNNANVTLDLNGQTVGNVGVLLGTVNVDNASDAPIATIDGSISGTANFLTKNVRIDFDANEDEGDPAFNYTTPTGTKIVKSSDYFVIVDSYAITTVASPTEGGTVTVKPTSAAAGETVKVTAEPAEGYKLVTIMAGEDDITAAKEFTMPAEAVTVTATFEQEITDVTVTLKASTGIASISKDSVTGEPGNSEVVTLTAVDTIKVPVFKADGVACGSSYTVVIPNANTEITFTATEASSESEKDAADALVNLGMDGAKLAALQGSGVTATAIATWAAKQATPADAVKGDFVGASVALDVAPITDATKIEVSEITKVEGGAMTFKVAIEDVEVAKAAIANMVKASANVDTWVDIAIDASFDDKTNEIVVTPADTTLTKAFMKVVIPADK